MDMSYRMDLLDILFECFFENIWIFLDYSIIRHEPYGMDGLSNMTDMLDRVMHRQPWKTAAISTREMEDERWTALSNAFDDVHVQLPLDLHLSISGWDETLRSLNMMVPCEGHDLGGRVCSTTAGASDGSLEYCAIRSTETILFSNCETSHTAL